MAEREKVAHEETRLGVMTGVRVDEDNGQSVVSTSQCVLHKPARSIGLLLDIDTQYNKRKHGKHGLHGAAGGKAYHSLLC